MNGRANRLCSSACEGGDQRGMTPESGPSVTRVAEDGERSACCIGGLKMTMILLSHSSLPRQDPRQHMDQAAEYTRRPSSTCGQF